MGLRITRRAPMAEQQQLNTLAEERKSISLISNFNPFIKNPFKIQPIG
jgi:hypothetical protein